MQLKTIIVTMSPATPDYRLKAIQNIFELEDTDAAVWMDGRNWQLEDISPGITREHNTDWKTVKEGKQMAMVPISPCEVENTDLDEFMAWAERFFKPEYLLSIELKFVP